MSCVDLSSFNEFWHWRKIQICLPMCLAYLALRHSFTRGQLLKNSRERGRTCWNTWHFTQPSKRETEQRSEGSSRGCRAGVPLQKGDATAEWRYCCRTGVLLQNKGAATEPGVSLENHGSAAEWECCCRMGVPLQNRGFHATAAPGVLMQNGGAATEQGCLWQIW